MSTKMLFDSAQLLGQHGQKALLTAQNIWWQTQSGVRLNKKDSLTRYGNSHVKDKTS